MNRGMGASNGGKGGNRKPCPTLFAGGVPTAGEITNLVLSVMGSSTSTCPITDTSARVPAATTPCASDVPLVDGVSADVEVACAP